MMKYYSLVIALVLFSNLFSTECIALGEVELVFSSAVEVSPRPEVSIYDIVEAKNLDDDMANELKKIVIKDSSLNVLSKTELAKILRTIKARFVLPNDMKIIRSQSVISRMEVERKIKNKIYSNCSDCEVQVQISSVPNTMANDWTLDLNIDLTKSTLMVPIFSVKNSENRGWIVAEIKKYQNVPVLNKSVKIGEILTENMLTLEKREISNRRDTVLKIESVVGMQVTRFLNTGQIIQYTDLKKEQVLKKGQMVRAMVGGADFEVAISAEVQEAGAIGEIVKVKNLDSQKVFAAKIVDRGIVRIE